MPLKRPLENQIKLLVVLPLMQPMQPAILYTPVQQISIVGNDFPQQEFDDLKARGVVLDGVEIVKDKPSFFWHGRYHLDMNTRDTLVTDLNVLADFDPESAG